MQIKDNIIYGAITAGLTHTILIEGNLIVNTGNNGAGISMSGTEPEQIPEGTITIENNTIADSYYGVDVSFYGYQYVNTFYLNLAFNNFENITGYNLYWYSFTNLNATLNYWGTTDEQIINQSIYDSKNDFNLGTVTFTPFLTSPNPEAIPNPNAPIPTPYLSPTETPTPTQSPTQTPTLSPTPIPTPSPSVPEFPTWTILFLTATATLLTALFIKRKLQLSSQKIVR
jgi:hypothetical protein